MTPFAALALLSLLGGSAGAASGVRPSIVIVSIDNLRADHLGCYGYSKPVSPNLDALARGAVLFENHISPGTWTPPAHMSMLTSLYPSFHGLTRLPGNWSPGRQWRMWLGHASAAWRRLRGLPALSGPAPEIDRLRPGVTTLAEALRGAGYRTAAFVAAHNLDARYGFARGFDVFVDSPERTPASAQNEAALRWIRDGRGAPFFLFLHYYDLHHVPRSGADGKDRQWPYDCPGPFQDAFVARRRPVAGGLGRLSAAVRLSRTRDWAVGLYDGCIQRADADLGALFDRLRASGVYEGALIMVTSDHGESFWEHGRWGHGQELYQEIIHTPLLLKAPAQEGARRVRALTSGVDLMPTILETARAVSADSAAQMQGVSLWPVISGSVPERPAVYSESELRGSGRAVLAPDRWKLISALEPRRTSLYDLRYDRGERVDRSLALPGKAAEMETLLLEFFAGPLRPAGASGAAVP